MFFEGDVFSAEGVGAQVVDEVLGGVGGEEVVQELGECILVVVGVIDRVGGDCADAVAGGVEEGFDFFGQACEEDLGAAGVLDASVCPRTMISRGCIALINSKGLERLGSAASSVSRSVPKSASAGTLMRKPRSVFSVCRVSSSFV